MKNLIVLGLLALLLGGMSACSKSHEGHKMGGEEKTAKLPAGLYHCPMHPTYTSDGPGECSICGMSLVPVEQEESGGASDSESVAGLSAVKVNARRRQLIGLKKEVAQERRMTKVLRTVGRIAYDPELYRTQEEYLTALATMRRLETGGEKEALDRVKNLLAASRLRLKIQGLSDGQIEVLSKRGKPELGLLLSQGKGQKVWMYMDVYERDLDLVKAGQDVEAFSSSLSGRVFRGKLKAIDPGINPKTRSARARVQLDDPDGKLLPDMYLNARISVDMGRLLAVPDSSIIDTGVRQVIFVDEGEGYLSPRVVSLGARAEGYVEVRGGVEEGEEVVTSGNFLIDSESRLKSAISAIAGGSHQH